MVCVYVLKIDEDFIAGFIKTLLHSCKLFGSMIIDVRMSCLSFGSLLYDFDIIKVNSLLESKRLRMSDCKVELTFSSKSLDNWKSMCEGKASLMVVGIGAACNVFWKKDKLLAILFAILIVNGRRHVLMVLLEQHLLQRGSTDFSMVCAVKDFDVAVFSSMFLFQYRSKETQGWSLGGLLLRQMRSLQGIALLSGMIYLVKNSSLCSEAKCVVK